MDGLMAGLMLGGWIHRDALVCHYVYEIYEVG